MCALNLPDVGGASASEQDGAVGIGFSLGVSPARLHEVVVVTGIRCGHDGGIRGGAGVPSRSFRYEKKRWCMKEGGGCGSNES